MNYKLLAELPSVPPVSAPRNITNPLLPPALQSGLGIDYFQKLIPALISLIFVIGTLIFFFMLLIGGVQWITSGGDKAGVESARGRITSALIGLVILFSTFAIAKLIETFFGISILTLDIDVLRIQ